MADEKNQTGAEREYTIPLRKEWRKVPRYKRANKAVKAIKEFMARHMKIYDRDLSKVKIDRSLNEELWFRGIKKPPARIRVKAFRDGEIVRVQLSEMPEKLRFKRLKEEKREKKADEMAKKGPKAGEQEKKEEKISEEQKHEEKEKKAAAIEAEGIIEKQFAKEAKHRTKQSKQPKHQRRKALAK
jgi:large subunit ribosomal protein L31e